MPTVGSLLSSERIRQGLELQDIAQVTKVTPRALQAIEQDNFEQLPGVVFARNFVRQYAEALHLDAGAVCRQFDREQAVEDAGYSRIRHYSALPPTPEFAPRLQESRLAGLFSSDLVSAFVTFVATLAICAGAFWGFEYWRGERVAETAKQPRRVMVPVQNPPATQVLARAPVASEAPPTNAASVHVEMTAVDTCWARVTGDGKLLFVGTLAAGETRVFEAAAVMTMRAGNAGALALKLNGTALAPLGPVGRIASVTLTPAGAQVRAPSPELAADF